MPNISNSSEQLLHGFYGDVRRTMEITAMTTQLGSLPVRDLEPTQPWDIVIVGAGPAGCAAAISAGEEGAKVLLIERTCSPGGMGTVAMVPAWCPFTDREKQIHEGLAGRILRRSKQTTPHVPDEQLDWVPIAAEHLKVIYEDELAKAGVTVRYDTFLVHAESDGAGGVSRIIVADKSGLNAIRARTFIDCTGDGDLVARAGFAMQRGDEGGGSLQPVTLCFTLANVKGYERGDRVGFKGKPADGGPSIIQRILAEGRYPLIPDEHICTCWVGPGCVGFNAGHIYEVDNTDPASVSRAMADGRKLAHAYRDALAEYDPEHFGEAFLVSTGSLIGARETRRIVAEYELTIEDYIARRSFDDEICRNAYFIDIHLAKEELAGGDWEEKVHARFDKYGPGESHGIPYRCLRPRGATNVLVAGRCIGTDRPVNGSVRVMPVCLCTGEAAGVAAAMAICGDGAHVGEIDVQALRARLRERGAYLPDSNEVCSGTGAS